jgi:putative dehydrogenase
MVGSRRLGMAKGKVGIVGLGIMGGAFAKNLVAAGWRVVGYDIDPARRRTMARAGVEIAPDTKTLAAEVATSSPACPSPPRSMQRLPPSSTPGCVRA